MKNNTIYRQLLLNIVFPVLLGLLIIGIFSYRNTQKILRNNLETEQSFIYDEIRSFIELQFVALSIIEEPVERQMKEISDSLVYHYFKNTQHIESANLMAIMNELNLPNTQFDLYILNRDGIVVNTTFKEDLYINFFSFGKAHKQYLQNVFKKGEFDSPRFFFEHKTKRYKKYSYHTTLDQKYIVEIGMYSEQADKIYDYTINHLVKIPKQQSSIETIDLFFYAEKPYPLNLKREFFPQHENLMSDLVSEKRSSITASIPEQPNKAYSYLYLKSKKPRIFDGVIIRISRDTSAQKSFVLTEGLKIITVLFVLITVIFLLITYRAKLLVAPIKKLTWLTKSITEGNLNQKVNISGNNELAVLSEQFNKMAEKLMERNVQIEEQQEFLYKSNRKLNEAYKLLNHQKKLIESKQIDLTASINYAYRIQDALMPPTKSFTELFDDSFIYMLPRDIVSGDFYWFSKNKQKAIVVASDCTGHGVPGAFMSMVGVTILHHLVDYEQIFDPAVLLTRLDSEICDLLLYNKNSDEQRFEGMDLSICSIDFETNQMLFSSAQRPVIHVRDGHLTSYKGGIYPIGEYYDDIQKIFHNVQVELKEGDIIYMFSDGYTSQFNEGATKKFNFSRFKKLLIDIQYKKLKDQPAIIHRTLEAWKGEQEQIDDILVMGFRYKKKDISPKVSAKNIIDLPL